MRYHGRAWTAAASIVVLTMLPVPWESLLKAGAIEWGRAQQVSRSSAPPP